MSLVTAGKARAKTRCVDTIQEIKGNQGAFKARTLPDLTVESSMPHALKTHLQQGSRLVLAFVIRPLPEIL